MNEEQDKLVLDNMNLVYFLVKKNFYLNDDFIELGMIGLVKGVKSFDPSKGFKLSTYLSRCILNEINMYLRNNAKRNNDVSLDNFLEENLTYHDLFEDEKINVEEDFIQRDEKNRMLESINKLSDKEQYIIIHSYGLYGKDKLTQKEIANNLGYSQCHISRLYKKILIKLKCMMEE